jgi:hypothetical protein
MNIDVQHAHVRSETALMFISLKHNEYSFHNVLHI